MSFSALFIGYLLLVVLGAMVALGRYLSKRASLVAIAIVLMWLGYATILGVTGAAARFNQLPPGLILLTGPVIAVLLALALTRPGAIIAARIPLVLLLGFQVFRVGVELSLHHLYSLGLAPRIITLEGGNIEILVAITAPIAAWLVTRGATARKLAWIWNLVGIASLANVVGRAVLSAPGPLQLIHAEVPDLAILTWPFTFVPGVMAPLAMTLHILAFRGFANVERIGSASR